MISVEKYINKASRDQDVTATGYSQCSDMQFYLESKNDRGVWLQ